MEIFFTSWTNSKSMLSEDSKSVEVRMIRSKGLDDHGFELARKYLLSIRNYYSMKNPRPCRAIESALVVVISTRRNSRWVRPTR